MKNKTRIDKIFKSDFINNLSAIDWEYLKEMAIRGAKSQDVEDELLKHYPKLKKEANDEE
jgi:hypothetical protein